MSNVYFASDHHFGHAKVLQFEEKRKIFSSIEEHDEEIVRRHNAVVRKRDLVYYLGDVSFRDEAETVALLERMHGVKKLVRGNHDILPTAAYLRCFEAVYGVHAKYGFVMSHVPLHPESVRRWGLNVHGHTHGDVVMKQNGCGGGADVRYLCVSLEQIDFSPLPLDAIRSHIKEYNHIVAPVRGHDK